MMIPGFALRHVRTVASCASASVKSYFPSNKAIPRNGGVVSTLLRYRFFTLCSWLGCLIRAHCNDVPFEGQTHRRGTDFVGWDSSAIYLRNPSGAEGLRHLFSQFRPFCPARVQGLQSASQGVVRSHKSTVGKSCGPRMSAAPARSEAWCLVLPNGNHVRVHTLEAPPVH